MITFYISEIDLSEIGNVTVGLEVCNENASEVFSS